MITPIMKIIIPINNIPETIKGNIILFTGELESVKISEFSGSSENIVTTRISLVPVF